MKMESSFKAALKTDQWIKDAFITINQNGTLETLKIIFIQEKELIFNQTVTCIVAIGVIINEREKALNSTETTQRFEEYGHMMKDR